MNIHEKIDRFLEQTPRKILLQTLSMLGLAIGFVVLIFFLGVWQGRDWADSEYLQERDARMQKITVLENEAKEHQLRFTQILAQNEILKKQTEAAAETLRKFDASIRGDTAKLENLIKTRNSKIEEINAETDYLKQIRGICDDYRVNGFGELSFCSRFEEK